jgi:rod shape-determining protein MreC
VKKNNSVGIIEWDGNSPQMAILNEIPHHANIAIGDSVVTSGFSAIFPEGLYVGSIADYTKQEGNFYRIKIQLGVDFQSLFYVNVIHNFLREEMLELESNISR